MKLLITAGPTYERIDPVRFIGNYSSGKMGFALAEAAVEAGYEVILIAGPVSLTTQHSAIQRIDVESAQQMYDAVMQHFESCDIAILCAAVADFTPIVVADQKIKREKDHMLIELKPTQDIAASVGRLKKSHQFLVGFALETNDEEKHALGKMQRKNLDFIVLNSLQDENACFGYDTNKVTILDIHGNKTSLPLMSKQKVAQEIIDKLPQQRH
jgi:phosphopantothenoylcysteine decarboxylase/phosphopantothenate--cysteine ligase